jgi:dTDP-4-amino-4,6-dideoxygalactose transaminase
MSIAEKHGLIVIEDAACALGATINGRFAGSYGRFASFSLHPRKAITSGEGGLLVCGNAGDAEQVAILRNHGVQMQDGVMEFVANGYNYRLTDFQAALVLSQMTRLDDIIAYKNELAQIYLTTLRGLALRLPGVPDGYRHTWQTFHTVVPDGIDRDGLIAQLKARGVGANYGAQCMPYMQVFQKKYGFDCASLFPHALRAYKQGLALPLYDKMTVDDANFVADSVAELIGSADSSAVSADYAR